MILLPEFSAQNRIKLMILGCSIFSLVYLGAANFPLSVIEQAPIINLDTSIKWLPWTVIIYLSQYLYLPFALLYAPNKHIATRTYYGYLVATLLASAIFLLYPTELPQRDLSTAALPIIISLCYQFLYYTDVPANCFPSLHTMLALIAATSLMKRGLTWQIVASLWTIAIIVSTLTTKQHCILDVLAGMLLFSLGVWVFPKWFDRRINGRIAITHNANT